MKTRREFFKLFGKAALVGSVVAAAPAVVLPLTAAKPDIGELANAVLDYPLVNIPHVHVGPFEEIKNVTVTTTDTTTLYAEDGHTPIQTWTTHETPKVGAIWRTPDKTWYYDSVNWVDITGFKI